MTADTFNELPAHVWPLNARREEDGVVTIGEVPLPDIVERFGSPVFVIDEADFRTRARDMADAFGGPDRVHYASKAFLTRTIARWVDEEGLALDVASEGELRIALAAGFPAPRITAHGNNKSRAFLELCLDAGVGHIVIDSFLELDRLAALTAERERRQPVLVRVTPGIEAHTHEFIATAHEDQKFGLSLATGEAFDAVRRALATPGLQLDGLHCHVGSQVFDADGFTLAAERILGLLERIRTELGVALKLLDLGGGFGIAYTAQEAPLDVHAVAADLLSRVDAYARGLGIETPTVLVEPGRALIGSSTVTVYEVGTIKDVQIDDDRVRRYLSVDGGMSDNIRPALYGAKYDARVVGRFVDGEDRASRVVGLHCESGDILIDDIAIPEDVAPGDLLALAATGAYCYVMSSNYNAVGRPAVVSVCHGRATLMLRRETIEDLLAREA